MFLINYKITTPNILGEEHFNDICSVEETVHPTRIGFYNNWYIAVDTKTNQLDKRRQPWWANAIERESLSMAVFDREILEIFFKNYNIQPIWLPIDFSQPLQSMVEEKYKI